MFPLLSGIPVLRVAPAVPPGRDVGNACSPVRRGAGPSGCSTRAGADNMRYRARPVHAHHGTTVRGASVWTSAGDGKGPATDAAGP